MKLVYPILLILILSGCSTKKNTLKNRTYHNLTTWFNTLFNGQEAMDKKIEELKSNYKDDYLSVLNVEPLPKITDENSAEINSQPITPQGISPFARNFNTNDSPNEEGTKSGFEKAEQKALKAIENHSMQIRGEERNRLISRAYLMLGKARYYQGKTFQAIEALKEVERLPFEKHKFEAKFYEALALQQAGNNGEAADILAQLSEKELKKKLKTQIFKHLAQSQFNNEDYNNAIQSLNIAIASAKNKETKARLTYILGQYYTKNGQFKEANAAFDKVYKLKPGFEMEARAQLAKALNFQPEENNYLGFRDQLLKLTHVGTYKDFYNEFYYGLGKIELKNDSTQKAKEYFEKALKENISDARYRGETYAELAHLYFSKSDYIYASAYYDSAVAVYPSSERKDQLSLTQKSLKSIKDKYYTIQKNDSILRLAKMSPAEQETFFKDFVTKLKIQDEEKLKKEKRISNRKDSNIDEDNFTFDTRSLGKFYFYNTSAAMEGEQSFINTWGKRSLQDNWRYSTTEIKSIEEEKSELLGAADLKNPRRYETSYYIEQIPNKDSLSQLKIERDSLSLALGMEYFENFNNINLAHKTLEDLLKTPPKKEEVKIETLFQLYHINKGNSNAETYKNRLINEYPNSIFAQYILNPKKSLSNTNSQEAIDLYNQIYTHYTAKEYPEVHLLYEKAKSNFSHEPIFSKIKFMEAFSLAKTTGAEAYINLLKEISSEYRDTPEGNRAKELLEDFNARYKSNKPKAEEKEISNDEREEN